MSVNTKSNFYISMNLGDLRLNYSLKSLRKKDLFSDPFDQFKSWLNEAKESQIIEPNAMVLATCTKEGYPSTRTVLLKHLDAEGLYFFTNYQSRKALEISENSHVAITFLWKEIERQVNIIGDVEKIPRHISIEYFANRPRKSQLGAAASEQSSVIPSRKILEDAYARLEKLYEGKPVACPECWGGYKIRPTSFEFWQGRPDRLHDRFRYKKNSSDDLWTIERLSP